MNYNYRSNTILVLYPYVMIPSIFLSLISFLFSSLSQIYLKYALLRNRVDDMVISSPLSNTSYSKIGNEGKKLITFYFLFFFTYKKILSLFEEKLLLLVIIKQTFSHSMDKAATLLKF